MALRLKSFLLLIWIPISLIACGGGAVQDKQLESETIVLRSSVNGCTNTTQYDTGTVLYIKISSTCGDNTGTWEVNVFNFNENTGLEISRKRLNLKSNQSADQLTDLGPNGSRYVELVSQGTWRKVNHRGSWGGRDGAGLLNLNGDLYLLGGWLYGPTTNEVWKTSNLIDWKFLGYAPWEGRHGAAWLVHNSRLYVIGGDLKEDVWSSPDGVNWLQHTPKGPFGQRYTPNAVSINGKLLLYSGQDWGPTWWCYAQPDCFARGNKSVWESRDGFEWSEVQESVPWQPRALVHGSIVHDGFIYVIGGGLKVPPPNERYAQTFVEYKDIWRSRNGVEWEMMSNDFGFTPRTHFSVVHTSVGCFVSDGSVGTQSNLSNDLLHASNCVDFKPIKVPVDLPLRHASSLVDFNGSLILIGGPREDGAANSVWQYFY